MTTKTSLARLVAFFFGCLVFAALVLHPAPLLALSLEMPSSAAQGTVVAVRVEGFTPHEKLSFTWLGKTHSISMPGTQGSLLLPVPVDASAQLTLSMQGTSGQARATLAVSPVKWPKQALQVDKNYVNPPQKVQRQIAMDRQKTLAVLGTVGETPLWTQFVRPVPGTVSSAFGGQRVFNGQPRSWHRGVDLRGATDSPVQALSAGRVALAEPLYFAGNAVFIDHGHGIISSYAHLNRILVQTGDQVEAGQTLGLVGATGRVTGPHLHLGLNIFGVAVDALSVFSLQPYSIDRTEHGKKHK